MYETCTLPNRNWIHKKLKVKTIKVHLHNESMIAMLGKLYDVDAVTDLTCVRHLQFVYLFNTLVPYFEL